MLHTGSYYDQASATTNGPETFNNNFRFLRMITAVTVAATHCLWIVYGFNPADEWPLGVLMQASHCGICIFFGLSGYLITASLTQRPEFMRYVISRIVRLCPLLIFSSVLIAFVVGPFFSTAGFAEYYGDWRLWAYVPVTALAYSDMTLPGLFEMAPAGGEVNVSIWTLKYEIIAYVVLGLMAALGLLHHRLMWAWAGAALLGYFYLSYMTELRTEIAFLQHGLRFGFAFLMGVLIYSYRRAIPLNLIGVFFVVGLAAYTNSSAYMEPFRITALVYTALWFGSKQNGLFSFYNHFGDYSYGIFIFHWPIAQLVLQSNPGINYSDLLVVVLPLTFALSVVSWHCVEAPLLATKGSVANWIKDWFSSLWQAGVQAARLTASQASNPTQAPLKLTQAPLNLNQARPGIIGWGQRGFEIMTRSTPEVDHLPSESDLQPSGMGGLPSSYEVGGLPSSYEVGGLPSSYEVGGLPPLQSRPLPSVQERHRSPVNPNLPASFRPQATGYQLR